MVIHGATDGCSRGITYLHCSTNNQAQTVLTLFRDTIVVYGLHHMSEGPMAEKMLWLQGWSIILIKF